MNTTQKAQTARERHQAARAELCQEQAQTMRAARQALQRVFEVPEATAEQVLEAAKLLVELSGTRRY